MHVLACFAYTYPVPMRLRCLNSRTLFWLLLWFVLGTGGPACLAPPAEPTGQVQRPWRGTAGGYSANRVIKVSSRPPCGDCKMPPTDGTAVQLCCWVRFHAASGCNCCSRSGAAAKNTSHISTFEVGLVAGTSMEIVGGSEERVAASMCGRPLPRFVQNRFLGRQ